jgi:VanZ family protein
MKSSHTIDKKTILLFILNILWMTVIFYFSSQPAQESSQVSGFVRDLIDKAVSILFNGHLPGIFTDNKPLIEHLVRKLGHVTEYLILGILTCSFLRRLTLKKAALIALAICILYASSDEFHQMFVNGRGPAVMDVLLDSAASAAGICIISCRLFFHAVHKFQKQNRN